jgi:glycosyltransferase involved in cell wall biosynthesis
MASLTFGFSTLADRLENIQLPNLEDHPDWDVLITVQSGTANLPTEEQLAKAPRGERVQVLAFAGVGVTKIRNQVLTNAKGDYLLFADDDISFNEEGILNAIEYMKDGELALLLGQAVDETGRLRKSYPTKPQRLNKLNSAKAATYEMLVNTKAVKQAGISFDENFGAGAPETYLGDEYIFIADLVAKSLNCYFVPITLATHPTDSSGSGWGTPRDRKARALIFDRVFQGNRTLPYLARIGFGLRKLGKGFTFKSFLLFVFKR